MPREGSRPETPCNVCHGEGRIKKQEKIIIKIPAGVDNEQIIKVKRKGDAGRRGGEEGSLYIIFIKPHALFIRKEMIFIESIYFFFQAVLEIKLKFPHWK
jgi:molecular chaperone DnaJ